MLIFTTFDKCGDNDASVDTFVAKICLVLDSAALFERQNYQPITNIIKINLAI